MKKIYFTVLALIFVGTCFSYFYSYEYFIGLKDNIVIVYTADRSTIFEYTNINATDLPVEVQTQLSEGIYIKGDKELYNFLQAYTS